MPNYRNKNKNRRNKNRNKNNNNNNNSNSNSNSNQNKNQHNQKPPHATATTSGAAAEEAAQTSAGHERQAAGNVSNENLLRSPAIEAITSAAAAAPTATAGVTSAISVSAANTATERVADAPLAAAKCTAEISSSAAAVPSNDTVAPSAAAQTERTRIATEVATQEQEQEEQQQEKEEEQQQQEKEEEQQQQQVEKEKEQQQQQQEKEEQQQQQQEEKEQQQQQQEKEEEQQQVEKEEQQQQQQHEKEEQQQQEPQGELKAHIAAATAAAADIWRNMGEQNSKLTPESSDRLRVVEMQTIRPQGQIIVHRIVKESASPSPPPQRNPTPETSPTPSSRSRQSESEQSAKVIIHRVLLEEQSTPPEQSYAEEASNRGGILIQEVNDASLSDYNENPPLVSEAESEPESVASPTMEQHTESAHILSIQTLSPCVGCEDDGQPTCLSPPTTDEDLKQRQRQTRAALEAHFRPQFLSPRYLDSITEENSDMSDAHSDCSDQPVTLAAAAAAALDSDYIDNEVAKAKRANAIFPRSNLDFSKKHKHGALPKTPLLPGAIREEPPMALMLETKFVDQMSAEESCTRLSSVLAPESEAPEVVYINSASSSASDLRELELEDSDAEWTRLTVDLDTDVSEIIARPAADQAELADAYDSSRERTPVNRSSTSPECASEVSGLKPLTAIDDAADQTNASELPKNAQLTRAAEHLSTFAALSAAQDRRHSESTAAAGQQSTSTAENPKPSSSYSLRAEHFVQPGVRGENTKMNNVREYSVAGSVDGASSSTSTSTPIYNSNTNADPVVLTTPVQTLLDTRDDSPPPIPPPPRHSTDTAHVYRPTQLTLPNPASTATLTRQESADSHCSDSTSHSQCTAINVGASPHSDFDVTSPISEKFESWPNFNAGTEQPATATADDNNVQKNESAIKKLRLLCTETVASMPYGDEVLEELATVAHNIGRVRASTSVQGQPPASKMPYPLPDLPHINELQLSLASSGSGDVPAPQTVTLQQAPAKQHSPTPPPVPAPPSERSAPWLGLPTNANPQLLVCLSPSQRSYMSAQKMTADNQPDQLLDAHQKFVERRGYHEYSAEQVQAMNSEKLEEQRILETAAIMKKLRKSLTPTPPPIPPPPVPVKSSQTVAKAQNQANSTTTTIKTTTTTGMTAPAASSDYGISFRNANERTAPCSNSNNSASDSNNNNNNADGEENKHRLLAIIHDTAQQTPKTSSLENSSRQPNSTHEAGVPLEAATAPTTEPTVPTTVPTVRTACSSTQLPANDATPSRLPEQPESASWFGASASAEQVDSSDSKRPSSMQSIESELGRMFPAMGGSNIFDVNQRRFSNIESSNSQLLSTQPKRYSSIETSSFESKKRLQNGQVVYDYSTANRESRNDGDKSLATLSHAADQRGQPLHSVGAGAAQESRSAATTEERSASQTASSNAEEIMSAFKLKTDGDATAATSAPPAVDNSQQASRRAAADAQNREALRRDFFKNRQMSEHSLNVNKDISGTYEEFRQRAKTAAAAAPPAAATTDTTAKTPSSAPVTAAAEPRKSAFHFDHDTLFKDFDDLSQQLHMELESGKARKRMQYERAASLYDLSRMPSELRHEFAELKQQRHEHMQGLEREIERSMRSRQLRQSSKPRTPNPPEQPAATATRSFEIPIQLEGDSSSTQPKTYEIPVQLDPAYKVSQPVTPQNQSYEHAAAERYRRAESMFDVTDNVASSSRQRSVSLNCGEQQSADDWSRYASDLGSSENIARPIAREVEICYQRFRPNAIRAPRLTVSTNDLYTPVQQFDSHNAYGVRRTQAPMLQQTAQRAKPQHLSCHSMLERDPNPTYITTTSRRGVSPAPPPTPDTANTRPAYHAEQPRRASLPREIHEQQLKYISSKEEELRTEVERLQNERLRLLDEMNRAPPLPPQPRANREHHYRPAPRLPTLSEDEVFRQQMAEEWLNKVAEREERRLHKIIKISKVHEDEGRQHVIHGGTPTINQSNISDEFLNRVKERRSKLAMPSDSDWESGAESQPVAPAQNSESEEAPSIKVIEGKSETDYKHLPKHLREFARFANHQSEQIDGEHREVREEEERRQEATGNSLSSAVKKSSVVKTVKISAPSYAAANGSAKAPTTIGAAAPPTVSATASTSSGQGRRSSHTVEQNYYHNAQTLQQMRQSRQPQPQPLNTGQRAATPRSAAANQLAAGNHPRAPLPPANNSKAAIKRARFQPMPVSTHPTASQRNRRSWSESDLLKEIDEELKLAKGFLFADVFKVKNEYMSEPETENDRPKKMAHLGRRQYDGIGPVTNDGMPIILRSEVQEPHQHEWYKRLYQTIHKQKNGAGRHQYKAGGYQSEPEHNNDSDYSIVKYRTLDRRRLQPVSSTSNVRSERSSYQNDKIYGTMPNPIKSGQISYKNQPGRIENYTTGQSSVSEKEHKEHLEQTKLSPHYTEGNLSRALAKESGYTSDSNLVFRKKEVPPSSALSPVEQKQAYKSVQAGGEPPLFGFRKPAPEKEREVPNRYLESDVNIHFKTPVRHEYKHPMPEEELAMRQAEQMQKLYQEERRRKYLQELQDMNSRRHTDNFTPSQKSPIALNRYDDFQSDLAPKSPNVPTYRKATARALYNFQGQSARELSFRKGDVIYIRRLVDKNWYEGEHNAMIGLLPVNYVEIVNRDIVRPQTKKPAEGQARAKYNFQAQSGVELSLNKGELVTLTRRVDDNWFEGKIANRKGIFPVTYVEVLTDIGSEDHNSKTVITEHSTTHLRPSLDTLRTNINNEFNIITQNGHQPPNGILKDTRTLHKTDVLHVDTSTEPLAYRALYKYRPQNSDELELLEGDIVHVLEKCDDGWFVGTSQRTGCFGTFPGNYVERI